MQSLVGNGENRGKPIEIPYVLANLGMFTIKNLDLTIKNGGRLRGGPQNHRTCVMFDLENIGEKRGIQIPRNGHISSYFYWPIWVHHKDC